MDYYLLASTNDVATNSLQIHLKFQFYTVIIRTMVVTVWGNKFDASANIDKIEGTNKKKNNNPLDTIELIRTNEAVPTTQQQHQHQQPSRTKGDDIYENQRVTLVSYTKLIAKRSKQSKPNAT